MARSTHKVWLGLAFFLGGFWVSSFGGVIGIPFCFLGLVLIVRGFAERKQRFPVSRADRKKVRAELDRLTQEAMTLKQWFFQIEKSDPSYAQARRDYGSNFLEIFLRRAIFVRFLRGNTGISEARRIKLETNIQNAVRELKNETLSTREKEGLEFVRDFCSFELKNLHTIRSVLEKDK